MREIILSLIFTINLAGVCFAQSSPSLGSGASYGGTVKEYEVDASYAGGAVKEYEVDASYAGGAVKEYEVDSAFAGEAIKKGEISSIFENN